MTAIQLEFNLDDRNTDEDKLFYIQIQIDNAYQSMDKVRRKLFCELAEIKKNCARLSQENEILRQKIRQITGTRTEWIYCQENYLFKEKDA
jgi:hypothetical protein